MTAVEVLSGRAPPLPAGQCLAVVDTNVWLDIHHFRDPQSRPLAAALESLCWATARCEQTDAELTLVLQRAHFSSSPDEGQRLLECLRRWQARAMLFSIGAPAPWRCRDPQDQKFLDLAHVAHASVLLTKDKALLALARSARRHGLAILTPRQFADLPQLGFEAPSLALRGKGSGLALRSPQGEGG